MTGDKAPPQFLFQPDPNTYRVYYHCNLPYHPFRMLTTSSPVTIRTILSQARASTEQHRYKSARYQDLPSTIPLSARAALRAHFDFPRVNESAFYRSASQTAVIEHDERAQRIDQYVWRSLHFQSEVVSRIFMLRTLALHLFGNATYPQRVVEFGSAGSLAPSLAFPLATCFALDNRPKMFANEFNSIPPEVWKSVGLPAQVAYCGHFRAGPPRAKAYSFITNLLGNYERVDADIRTKTPLPSRQADLVVVFNSPTLLTPESTHEAARLLKPGGYLLRITDDIFEHPKGGKVTSFYDTERFRGWWEEIKIPYHTPTHPDGFRSIECPIPIRAWENLGNWRAHNGKTYDFGYTVEIFQRLRGHSKCAA